MKSQVKGSKWLRTLKNVTIYIKGKYDRRIVTESNEV